MCEWRVGRWSVVQTTRRDGKNTKASVFSVQSIYTFITTCKLFSEGVEGVLFFDLVIFTETSALLWLRNIEYFVKSIFRDYCCYFYCWWIVLQLLLCKKQLPGLFVFECVCGKFVLKRAFILWVCTLISPVCQVTPFEFGSLEDWVSGRGDVTLRPHFVYLMKMPMLFVSPVGNVTYVLQIRFSV